MCLTHGTFRDRICQHTNLREHIHDGTLRAARCEILHNIQTNGAAADYNHFFALAEIIRVFSGFYFLNHLENGIDMTGCDVFLESLDRRNDWNGTGCVDNDIRLELFDLVHGCLAVQENIQVFQSLRTCFQIFREVFHTVLAWQVGDEGGKSA